MPYVSDAQQQLVLDLLTGRLSESSFLRKYPVHGDPAELTTRILAAAVDCRDATDAEFGLYLFLKLGGSPSALLSLAELVKADWHERHEDAVDALIQLRARTSAAALVHAATTPREYRSIDESFSLEQKALRGLRSILGDEAREHLKAIVEVAEPGIAELARQELAKLER